MYPSLKALISQTLDIECFLEKPKDRKFGHFALPTFSLAKTLKKNPPEIAQDFAKKLATLAEIININVVGGYVNFSLSDGFLQECVKNFLTPKFLKNTKEKSKEMCKNVLNLFCNSNLINRKSFGRKFMFIFRFYIIFFPV